MSQQKSPGQRRGSSIAALTAIKGEKATKGIISNNKQIANGANNNNNNNSHTNLGTTGLLNSSEGILNNLNTHLRSVKNLSTGFSNTTNDDNRNTQQTETHSNICELCKATINPLSKDGYPCKICHKFYHYTCVNIDSLVLLPVFGWFVKDMLA